MAKDAKTRAKARALYEAGQSFAQIAPKVKAGIRSLKSWCKSEGWTKGESAPKLHQIEQFAIEREAEVQGITKAKVLAKIAEHIDAKSLAVITTQGAVSLAPMLAKAAVKDGKGEFQGIEYDVVPDRKTQQKAVDQAIAVLGMAKVQVDPSDEFRAFFGGLKAAK